MREQETTSLPGGPMLLVLLALLGASIGAVAWGANTAQALDAVAGVVVGAAAFVALVGGLFIVNPNEARVLQLFGRYVGTVRTEGLRWTNPFYSKRTLSLRVRNFETEHLKVNDTDGNPIEIAAIVVWRVTNTADALFHVDDYERFVKVQSEAAVRNLATHYSYDSHDDAAHSLRSNSSTVTDKLRAEIQERLAQAGVEVIEARLSHLAYAPEIAHAMLQRQQAGAIVAARQKIVEGAVGMVEAALARLSENKIVVLDEERRAAMVSNLLVVLCGQRETQPVINTGTIYQ